ncbi:MAG: hypothetical protein WCD02_10810, partial [Terriglobales bacterium]
MRYPAARSLVDLRRREFLVQCCQSASAALIPAGFFSRYAFDSDASLSSNEFHLHPHYRIPRPVDALLLKTQAGFDDFVTEKYADQIAAIFAEWSAALLQSPQDMKAIDKVLLADFSGSSLTPANSRLVRPGPSIEVRQNTYQPESTLGREAFLKELRSAMSGFSKILTAEFQVTSIDLG